MEEYPKLRPHIEVVPVTQQGRDLVLLHDRMGLSRDLLMDRRQGATLLPMLDGRHTLRDIQVAMMRQSGLGLISLDDIRKAVDALDHNFMLDGERFQQRKRKALEEFRNSPLRPPYHAGQAYPEDPSRLRVQLDTLFKEAQQAAGSNKRKVQEEDVLIGAVLPHIDLQRGGECYARGYHAIKAHLDADLYVILGTSHQPMDHPITLTTKPFQTPLGITECASELAHDISQGAGMDLFLDELVHRTEHTIEFQVLFLQYLLGGKGPFLILPVLCAGFHAFLQGRIFPEDNEHYNRCLRALSEALSRYPGRWCAIASADLAHLGPQFGDPRPVEESDLIRVRQDDMEMLDNVLRADAKGFYRHVMGQGDRRRICGLPPIYTLLKVVEPHRTELIHYGQAFHPMATVTFTSIALWSQR